MFVGGKRAACLRSNLPPSIGRPGTPCPGLPESAAREARVARVGALQHVMADGQPPRWLAWGVVLAALLCIGAGGAVCWQQPEAAQGVGYRATCGAILALLGVCQLWIARRLAEPGPSRPPACQPCSARASRSVVLRRQPLPWYRRMAREAAPLARLGRSILVGAVVCYVLAVPVGETHLRYVYPLALVLWYTVSLAAMAVPASVWPPLLTLASHPAARKLMRVVTCAAASLAGIEAGLQVFDVAGGNRLRAAYLAQTLKLPPGSQVLGRTVNSLGYWDDEFRLHPAPGTFRIAAVGRGATLWGPAGSNMLAQLEQRVPGVEVYNFGLANGTPQQYAAQLAGDVAAHHPHLVLVFVSAGDDLVEDLPPLAWFDPRSLRLYQMLWRVWQVRPSGGPPQSVSENGNDDYEAYLNRRARALAMFRTPIEPAVERRWQATFADLRRLIHQCRQRQLPLALVLVPDELQYRPVVREALCRRAGCQPSQLDLELPQRRLVRFAQRHELPMLDLLPFFRASNEPLAGPEAAGWTPQAHRVASDAIGHWLQVRFGGLIAAAEHRAAQSTHSRNIRGRTGP